MDRAEVSSVQAIADFRAALLVYLAKIGPLLDDSADEVFRTREWLRGTRRLHWEHQVRLRARALAEAEQLLFSAELSRLRAPSSAEIQAVQKAKRALAGAEEKLGAVKKLSTAFEKEAAPRLKQIESLRAYCGTGLQDGAHRLGSIVEALDQYLGANKPA